VVSVLDLDAIGPKQFHWYEKHMKRVVDKTVISLKGHAEPMSWDKLKRTFPWKSLIFILGFFVCGLFIKPVMTIDSTAWTGILTIDSTVTLGLMAILSWAIRPFIQEFPIFLDEAIKRGFYNPPPS
jgi:hypothetical protein